jgi:hypothetical protein
MRMMIYLLADSHKNFEQMENYFCQLLKAYGINGVWQAEMHIAELLLPKPCFKV